MKIVTSLSFKGQCREAFEFYARVLGGKVTAAVPYGDGPPGMPVDSRLKNWLMRCWLEACDQARGGFEQLAEGGRVVMPFAAILWSPGYGSLIDRFGVSWLINTMPGPDWKPSA